MGGGGYPTKNNPIFTLSQSKLASVNWLQFKWCFIYLFLIMKVDYFERAKRLEEIPLLEKQYQVEKQEMKTTWENHEEERVSQEFIGC